MIENKKNDGEPVLPVGAQFHEGIAAGWARGYARGGFGRRLVCYRVLLDRNVVPGTDWLDLGCGSGVLTRELLQRGAAVVAVDGSPGMLREAQAHGGGEVRAGLRWLQADVQSLPQLPDESFDGVLCSSVVEYLERPAAALNEAARLLRPGGKLIISVPPKWAAVRMVQRAVRKAAQIVGSNKFPYLAVSRFEIEPGHLSRWLNEAGFVLDRVTEFDPLLPQSMLKVLRPALLIAEAHKGRAR